MLIALIGVASTYLLARNTRMIAARKIEVDAQIEQHRKDVEELARKAARKAEVAALKLRIDQLEKENARLRRRITCLDKSIRELSNKPTDCND